MSHPAAALTVSARRRPAIPYEQWPEIVRRAGQESIRRIARDLGVSHEAVRTALRAAGRADLLADPGRRRRLEAAAQDPIGAS
jgi:hypothetical protein